MFACDSAAYGYLKVLFFDIIGLIFMNDNYLPSKVFFIDSSYRNVELVVPSVYIKAAISYS